MTPYVQWIIASGLAVQTAAKTIQIQVGSTGLNFSPNSISASQGDVLEFTFEAGGNHSVVMGDFNSACQPATSGGFFSGFIASSTPAAFSVTVNSTDPMVFYCAQNLGSHCKNGMSGVINPGGSSTLESYQKAAQSVSAAGSPPSVFGGTIGSVPSSSSTSTGTTSTGATSTSSSTTTTAPAGNGYGPGTTTSSTTTSTTASSSGSSKTSLSVGPIFVTSLVALLSAVTGTLFLI